MSKWTDPTKKQQVFMINKSVLTKIKAYATETDQPFDKVIEAEFIVFEQALLKKCAQIDTIRMRAIEASYKAREEQELIEQNPLLVSGKQENPLLESPIPQ